MSAPCPLGQQSRDCPTCATAPGSPGAAPGSVRTWAPTFLHLPVYAPGQLELWSPSYSHLFEGWGVVLKNAEGNWGHATAHHRAASAGQGEGDTRRLSSSWGAGGTCDKCHSFPLVILLAVGGHCLDSCFCTISRGDGDRCAYLIHLITETWDRVHLTCLNSLRSRWFTYPSRHQSLLSPFIPSHTFL